VSDRDGRGGVERIVPAWHGQSELVDRVRGLSVAIMEDNRKARLAVQVIEIGETNVGLRIFPVSKNAPILKFSNQRLYNGMIGTHDRKAVKRNVLDKGAECILHGVEGAKVVEMLGIDVRYDGDVSRKLQEGTVRFIGLDNHPISRAKPRVGAICIDDTAIDHGWIQATGVEQRCDQRGRGRFSVRARDGN